MRLFSLAALAASALVAACDSSPPQAAVVAHDVRVQLPAVPGRPGSAYFTLTSNNDPTRLVSVSSPRVERIELHETVTEGGIARMRPAQDLGFPSSGKLEFAPGGRHAMLFGIDPAVKAGDTIPLTFAFEPAPAATVEAKVVAFGDAGHAGH